MPADGAPVVVLAVGAAECGDAVVEGGDEGLLEWGVEGEDVVVPLGGFEGGGADGEPELGELGAAEGFAVLGGHRSVPEASKLQSSAGK